MTRVTAYNPVRRQVFLKGKISLRLWSLLPMGRILTAYWVDEPNKYFWRKSIRGQNERKEAKKSYFSAKNTLK